MIVAEGSRSREDGKEGDAWWMMMIDDEKWTWQMNLMTLMWWEYTTDWCFYGGFTQTNFYIFHREFLRTKKIQREVVTQRNFYTETFTQKYLYKENVYTQTGWHTHTETFGNIYTKNIFYRRTFTYRNFYIGKKNAQNNFYTQMDETWLPLPPWEKFGKIQVDHLEINSCEIKSCVRTPV
jgi:hypothetical protein